MANNRAKEVGLPREEVDRNNLPAHFMNVIRAAIGLFRRPELFERETLLRDTNTVIDRATRWLEEEQEEEHSSYDEAWELLERLREILSDVMGELRLAESNR